MERISIWVAAEKRSSPAGSNARVQTVQQDPVQVNVSQHQHNSKHGEIIPAKDEICHTTIATFEEIEGGEICSNFRVDEG